MEEKFLLGDTGEGNNRILIFGRISWLQHLVFSEIWFADGTFTIAPSLFHQVYVISAKKHDGVIPIVYALLPNKQRLTYSRLFELLKTIESNLRPVSIICDFEQAAIHAFQDAFPTVRIKGCFFPSSPKHAQTSCFSWVYRISIKPTRTLRYGLK